MSDRYRQTSEIFQVACELDPAQRDAYLAVRCQGDPALRAEVEELLGFDVAADALGTEAPPHRPLAPGELFAERYRILTCRSRGGSGVVYRAVDERLGQTVALKVLRTSSPARLERLAHEVRLARRITHPAVCRVHDIGESGREGYLTMEFVEGESLGERLRRAGPLPPDRVLELAFELLEGVAAAHAEGVLHGDLKPDNLLVDEAGGLHISDFGTAHGGEDAPGLPEGTPDYMAPERKRGAPVSARSDLYSLGVVLYELLTGALPATAPAPISHLVAGVPPRLERAIVAALALDPAQRPPSARLMLEGLAAAGPDTSPAPPPPLPGFEQRRVTALFWQRTDEREYALHHGLVLEDVLERFAARRADADRIVARHGGVVSQRMGARTLVLFGIPPLSADAQQRAAHAALELVESDLAFNRREADRLPDPPEIRVGLHTAISIVETTKDGHVYTSGAGVDVAQALAARAEAHQVLASAAVQSRATDDSPFDWVPRGKLGMGGGADPIACFELQRAGSSRTRVSRRPSSPLFGRREALDALEERWRRVRAGHGQVVLVRGEAGIGKSRLVQELRRRIDEPGLRWIEVSCLPYTANTPLYPVVEILSRISELRASTPEQRRERALDWLELHDLGRPEIRSGVERLLAQHGSDSGSPLAPPAVGRDFFQTLLPIAQRITQEERIVLVFEDLQWADPSTLASLRLAVMAMPALPELIVCTLPPDLELDWPEPEWLTELGLGPLADVDVRALVECRASAPLEPAVVDEITLRAEGNPSFAVALAEAGTGPSGSLPASLQDSLLARLDALGGAKRVAQLASVLGRDFRRSILVALANDIGEQAVDAALHQLEAAGIAACVELPPDARYRFQQALLRDAAHGSLPPTQRARLHQRAARVIEDSDTRWVQRNPEVIAYHLEQAGLAEETLHAWERTADRAEQAGAWTEATAHLTRALESVARLAHSSARDTLELQLLLRRSRAMLAGGFPAREISASFDRVHALCRSLPAEERIFRSLTEVWLHRSRLCDGQAAGMAEELVRFASATGDRHLEAVAAMARAQVASLHGLPREVRSHARRALELCDSSRRRSDVQQGRVDVVSLAQAMLARSAWLLGEPDRALETAEFASTVVRVLDGHHNSIVIESQLALLLDWLGEHEASRAAVERVLARPDRQGIGFFAATALGVRSGLRLREGEPEAALADARAAIALLEETGCVLGLGRAHTHLAEALAGCGDGEAAVEAAREAVRRSSHAEDRQLLAEAHRVRGERLLALDPRSAAGRQQLRAALRVSREQEALSLELRAALALERAGFDPEADRARLRGVRDRFREGFDTPDLREAARRLDPAGSRA